MTLRSHVAVETENQRFYADLATQRVLWWLNCQCLVRVVCAAGKIWTTLVQGSQTHQNRQKRPYYHAKRVNFFSEWPCELKLNSEQATRQFTKRNPRKNGAFVLSGHPNGQRRCHGSLKSRPQWRPTWRSMRTKKCFFVVVFAAESSPTYRELKLISWAHLE